MKVYLLNGPRAGDKIELLAETTVGRELDNHIPVMADGVSRYHAKFIHEKDGSWSVCDLNSTNGSRVNGSKISGTVKIKPGDVIEFGDQSIRFGDPLPEDIVLAEAAAAADESPTIKPSPVVFNFSPDTDSNVTQRTQVTRADYQSLGSGKTPKVVFKPVDTIAVASTPEAESSSLTQLNQEQNLFGGKHDTMTIPIHEEDDKKGDHEHLADMLNKVSLFGGKGRKNKDPKEDGVHHNKRRRSTNLMFYTLVVCAGIIAVGIFLWMQKMPVKKNVKAVVPRALPPFLLDYCKRKCTRDNVFQFSLRIENNKAYFAIDDLKSRRKFSKTIKQVDKEFVKTLQDAIGESEFMKLMDPPPAPARDDEQDTRSMLVCYKGKMNKINIVNTLAPTSFDSIERAIDDFAEAYNLQTISMTPEELIDKAKKFFYKAESLLQNKEANPANMRKALVRYTLTVEYLDQFSPKPEIWHQAMEKRKKVEAMLVKRRKELVFDYMKNIKMREYKKCLDVLEELMLISEPGGKQWTKARDYKINIERKIRQRNR